MLDTFGGAFFMIKAKKINTKYSPEFKLSVILDMRENGLSCRETVRKYWDAKNKYRRRQAPFANQIVGTYILGRRSGRLYG